MKLILVPPENPQFSSFRGHFRSKPGHVPRCINRSVLHIRRPTKISIYTLYPCTYYGMTTIGKGLDYFEIWPLEVDFGTPRKPQFSPFLGHFRSKPGHVPRCINRSVLHLRRPTTISIYALYPCTYYGTTTIGNGLDYLEI